MQNWGVGDGRQSKICEACPPTRIHEDIGLELQIARLNDKGKLPHPFQIAVDNVLIIQILNSFGYIQRLERYPIISHVTQRTKKEKKKTHQKNMVNICMTL